MGRTIDSYDTLGRLRVLCANSGHPVTGDIVVQTSNITQKSRYERLLLRWWSQATGPDDTQAARATGIVLDILRRLDTIGGLVPDKPLIQLNQQNQQIIQHESIRIDIGDVTEALRVLADAGAIRVDPNGHGTNGSVDALYSAPADP